MTYTYTQVYDDADQPDDGIYPGIEGLLWGLVQTTPLWMERASCRGMPAAVFFPERGQPVEQARRICAGCEVLADCAEHALATNEKFGIWGGQSEVARRRLRRLRKAGSAGGPAS